MCLVCNVMLWKLQTAEDNCTVKAPSITRNEHPLLYDTGMHLQPLSQDVIDSPVEQTLYLLHVD